MTREGELANADHLLALMEERRHGQRSRDDVNDAKLKELVEDLDGTNRRLILRAKNTGAWLGNLKLIPCNGDLTPSNFGLY